MELEARSKEAYASRNIESKPDLLATCEKSEVKDMYLQPPTDQSQSKSPFRDLAKSLPRSIGISRAVSHANLYKVEQPLTVTNTLTRVSTKEDRLQPYIPTLGNEDFSQFQSLEHLRTFGAEMIGEHLNVVDESARDFTFKHLMKGKKT